MLTYNEIMEKYNTTPKNEPIVSTKTLNALVQHDCENNLMGRILYAAMTGERYAVLCYGIARFDDSDYCIHYKRKMKAYLRNYGYENVSISFKKLVQSQYTSCTIKVYF